MESTQLNNNNANSLQRRIVGLPARIITNSSNSDGCNKRLNGVDDGSGGRKRPKDPYSVLLYNNGSSKNDKIIKKNYFNGDGGGDGEEKLRKNKFYKFVKKMLRRGSGSSSHGGSAGGSKRKKSSGGFSLLQVQQRLRQEKSPVSNLVINNEENRQQQQQWFQQNKRPSLIHQLETLLTKKSDDTQFLIESMYVTLPSPPITQPWYNESLTRDTASRLLQSKEVGSFYVRKSAKGASCYALSVKIPSQTSKVVHYLIQHTEGTGYRLKGSGKEFFTLQALVTHHSVMKERLPVPLLLARPNDNDKQTRKIKDYESIESLDKILDEMKIR